MIGMQRTQPHQSTAAETPGRMPIMSLQIVQQRNLLLQLVESLTTHGLLASNGRIRHSAGRSQATMVGACEKVLALEIWPSTTSSVVAAVPSGARWMHLASVMDFCSAALLAQQCRRRRSARRPVAGKAR